MMSNLADILADIANRSAYGLANDADTARPDAPESVGADWLDTVRRGALEAITEALEPFGTRLGGEEAVEALRDLLDDGKAHDVADSNVPIYNHNRMMVLVDLAAYMEDASEYGDTEGVDIVTLAGTVLYMVAERLTVRLFVEALNAAQADAEDAA